MRRRTGRPGRRARGLSSRVSAIRERLAAADPGNAGWQRDLSVSHDKIGDVRSGAGRPARRARRPTEPAWRSRERLAAAGPRQRRVAARPLGQPRQDRRRAGRRRATWPARCAAYRAEPGDRRAAGRRGPAATPSGSATSRSATTRSATCSWRRATCTARCGLSSRA